VFVIAAFGRVVDIPAWLLEVTFAAAVACVIALAALRKLREHRRAREKARSATSTS
jgi:hypothetical protein